MGSTDWMGRNLDRRIEVLVPILDKDTFAELKTILQLQLNDNVKARWQDEFDNNRLVEQPLDSPKIRSQGAIYEYVKHMTEEKQSGSYADSKNRSIGISI